MLTATATRNLGPTQSTILENLDAAFRGRRASFVSVDTITGFVNDGRGFFSGYDDATLYKALRRLVGRGFVDQRGEGIRNATFRLTATGRKAARA